MSWKLSPVVDDKILVSANRTRTPSCNLQDSFWIWADAGLPRLQWFPAALYAMKTVNICVLMKFIIHGSFNPTLKFLRYFFQTGSLPYVVLNATLSMYFIDISGGMTRDRSFGSRYLWIKSASESNSSSSSSSSTSASSFPAASLLLLLLK